MVELDKTQRDGGTIHFLHFNDVYNIHEREQTSEQDKNKLDFVTAGASRFVTALNKY